MYPLLCHHCVGELWGDCKTPVSPIYKGAVVNVSSFSDSLHMVSFYLPIYFKALNATHKEIMGGDNFKLSDY